MLNDLFLMFSLTKESTPLMDSSFPLVYSTYPLFSCSSCSPFLLFSDNPKTSELNLVSVNSCSSSCNLSRFFNVLTVAVHKHTLETEGQFMLCIAIMGDWTITQHAGYVLVGEHASCRSGFGSLTMQQIVRAYFLPKANLVTRPDLKWNLLLSIQSIQEECASWTPFSDPASMSETELLKFLFTI